MKDRTQGVAFRSIGQQCSRNEEKQAALCMPGVVQGELGVKKAAAEQAPEEKFSVSVQYDADAGKIGGKQIASAREREAKKREENECKYPSNHRDSVGNWSEGYTGKK